MCSNPTWIKTPPGTGSWQPPAKPVQSAAAVGEIGSAVPPATIARWPNESKPVTRAPNETVQQQRARFDPYTQLEQWGSVSARASTKPLTAFDFRSSQAGLPLPNLNDDKANGEKVRNPATGESYRSYEELQNNKDAVWRNTLAYEFRVPLAARLMRHYLGASGDTYEYFGDLPQLVSREKIDNYRAQLERSAVKFAQDNPAVSEFTIQGPMSSNSNGANLEVHYALGAYYFGERAHYKVTRDGQGKVSLDGQTQLFVFDRYNFRPSGTDFPLLTGGSVPQSNLMQMTIRNDPKTGKPMARAFEVILFENPQDSRIKSATT
jgi:hypothetical protein